MKKKKVAVILSLGAAALLMIGGISVYAHQFSDSAESETVYKETTAGYGTLTVGITERKRDDRKYLTGYGRGYKYIFGFRKWTDKWNAGIRNVNR